VQIGDPIGEGWAIYKRFWRHLLPISLVVAVIVSLIALALAAAGGPFALLASLLVSVTGTFLITAALTEAVADVRDGRVDLTLTETLARAWPRIGTVILLSIVAGLGIAIGFVLLIVPGAYLITIWSVAVPAAVLEKTGVFDSLGRSRALVRGYGWTVFGVLLVTFLVNIVASIVLAVVLSGLSNDVGNYVGNLLTTTLITPFVAAAVTCMYFQLRGLHEQAPVPAGAAFSDET
jgi:hypothetical protein